ncbi:MAG: helicase-related protein, partial [Cellvibrionaceae bacterium]|nr:helicase-related protein [Cellvibrionaceae bacterium]
RDDLQLMLMSATADIAAYQSQLPDAVHIESEGRAYPVEIHYRPQAKQGWLAGMVSVIAEAVAETKHGSTLVFLPGAGEIQRLQTELVQDSRFAAFDILPLHGGLPFAQQTKALTPPTTRRITLATNVAETSLTLPDITIVIDGGRERMVKFQLKNSIDQLITRRVSKASARQRAGRAGRLSAGCCYRLWSENEQHGLSEQLQPEIERSDVSALVMECAAWGVTEPEQLNWLTPPPHTAWQQAKQLLVALGLLSKTGQLREAGRRVQALGCPPRL